jgi:hypothetical protein
MIGSVNLTNAFMKKKVLSSGRNRPIAKRPIRVYITIPNR